MPDSEPLWAAILPNFEMGPEDEKPVARFLLLHALLDRWFVDVLALNDLRAIMKVSSVANDNAAALLDRFVDEYAEGVFGSRLGTVRKRQLLSQDHLAICEEMNQARNRFLHWKSGRYEVPRYRGIDVRESGGLDQCVMDVTAVIEAFRTASEKERARTMAAPRDQKSNEQ